MSAPAVSSASVNDLLRRAPAAAAVFNSFGVDTCCGGALPLDRAAEQAGVPLADLLAALEPVLASAARPAEEA